MLNEDQMEQLRELEEYFMDEEAAPEHVEQFFGLWPGIQDSIRGLANTDASGNTRKPAMEEVEELTDEYELDSMYNLLSDVETTLCQPQYAERHLQFCKEVLDLVDPDAEDTFVENYETGIGSALGDLGRKEEAKAHFEALLKKAVKSNYVSVAMWTAHNIKDKEWLSQIIETYVKSKTIVDGGEHLQELADYLMSDMKD